MALLTQRSSHSRLGKTPPLRRCLGTGGAFRQQHGCPGKAIHMLGALVCTVLWSWSAAPADMAVAREYQIKAIFLSNFVQFVTWPATAFPGPSAPLTIAILGDDPFGPFLEEAVRGEVIDGRSLTIKHLQGMEEIIGCQVLFVSKSEKERVRQILATLQGQSILTVGETKAFARQGGMINFITVNNKVRYEINLEAARRANIDISSKLLKLAKIVGSGMDN